jgi:Fe-S cluster biosynthesis and repair protein YggX
MGPDPNEPDKDRVGKKLFQQLSKLLWGPWSEDGKTWHVLDQGLIFRPKKIDMPQYEADKTKTIQMLKMYHSDQSVNEGGGPGPAKP